MPEKKCPKCSHTWKHHKQKGRCRGKIGSGCSCAAAVDRAPRD